MSYGPMKRISQQQDGSERGRLNPDIFHAAATNNTEELQSALRLGQRLDERKPAMLGMTPAHVACLNSSVEFMAAACSEPSLDPWMRDGNGYLPFDHAAARGDKVTAKALLSVMYPQNWAGPAPGGSS